ncbi:hypothetical protein H0H81_007230, partial [Sphagnurus paluster]
SDFDPHEQSPDLFILAHLLTLRLRIDRFGPHWDIVEDTIRRLVLPSIQNFELYISDAGLEFPLSPIFPALHASSTGGAMLLTRLVLVNTCLDQRSEFASMLRGCTALETLAMQFSIDCSEEVISVLLEPTDTIPPPSLPSLTAFVWVIDRDLPGFALKLSDLVRAWTSNPARRRSFEAVTIYALSDHQTDTTELTTEAFKEIKALLGPWREGGEPNECVAVAHSGMVLRTRIVSEWFTLTGIIDRRFNQDWPQE